METAAESSGLQYEPGRGLGGRPTPHPKKGKFFVLALHSEGWADGQHLVDLP